MSWTACPTLQLLRLDARIVEGYPQQIINFALIVGLLYLRWKKPEIHRPFKVWLPVAIFFLVAASFREFSSLLSPLSLTSLAVMVAPFLKPANGVGDTPPLPYYLYCLVGIGIMILGIVYWAVWRILLPRVFGYELVPSKETLSDGTVVTVVRPLLPQAWQH